MAATGSLAPDGKSAPGRPGVRQLHSAQSAGHLGRNGHCSRRMAVRNTPDRPLAGIPCAVVPGAGPRHDPGAGRLAHRHDVPVVVVARAHQSCAPQHLARCCARRIDFRRDDLALDAIECRARLVDRDCAYRTRASHRGTQHSLACHVGRRLASAARGLGLDAGQRSAAGGGTRSPRLPRVDHLQPQRFPGPAGVERPRDRGFGDRRRRLVGRRPLPCLPRRRDVVAAGCGRRDRHVCDGRVSTRLPVLPASPGTGRRSGRGKARRCRPGERRIHDSKVGLRGDEHRDGRDARVDLPRIPRGRGSFSPYPPGRGALRRSGARTSNARRHAAGQPTRLSLASPDGATGGDVRRRHGTHATDQSTLHDPRGVAALRGGCRPEWPTGRSQTQSAIDLLDLEAQILR